MKNITNSLTRELLDQKLSPATCSAIGGTIHRLQLVQADLQTLTDRIRKAAEALHESTNAPHRRSARPCALRRILGRM